MGGKGKLPVASLNKPGQGGQEAPLRETLSRISEGRFEAPFLCSFHPRRGTRGDGGRKQGKQMVEAEKDRSAEPEEERGPVATAVVRGAEKPGRRRPLPFSLAPAGVPAAHLLSLSWPGAWRCPPVRFPQQTLNGETMRAQSIARTADRCPRCPFRASRGSHDPSTCAGTLRAVPGASCRPLPARRFPARRRVGDRQQPLGAARRPSALGHLLQRLLGQGHG